MLRKIASLADGAFRSFAKYAYAVNQSHAKVATDPVYLAVARRLVPDDVPLSPRLLATAYAPNMFFEYRERARKLAYYVEDWDFSEARPDLLTPRQRQAMHTFACGETSGMAVSDGFLRAFRFYPELAAFFGVWFVEELNHFHGHHLYLKQMGETWPAERGLAVAAVDFHPYAEDPFEVAACNMYQELLGYLVYRRFATQVRDPFLASMIDRFAKDELRHYKFYQSVVARRIQEEPRFRHVVLKTILKATSPFNQVSGGVSAVLDNLEAAGFYIRKPEFEWFLKQVEFLCGTELRGFFDFYFRGLVPPCSHCEQPAHQCECVSFEDGAPQVRRDPDWWRRQSHAPDPRAAAWTHHLPRVEPESAPRSQATATGREGLSSPM